MGGEILGFPELNEDLVGFACGSSTFVFDGALYRGAFG